MGQHSSKCSGGSCSKKNPVVRASTLTPQQQQTSNVSNAAVQQLIQQMQQDRQQHKPFDFAPVEDLLKRQFGSEIIPSIAERFVGMGGKNLMSSSLIGALGAAGSDLESRLGALKGQVGLQEEQLGQGQQQIDLGRLQQLMGGAMHPAFENIYVPPTPQRPSFMSNLMGGLGSMLPFALGGPLGGLLGGLTGGLGSLFNKKSQQQQQQGPQGYSKGLLGPIAGMQYNPYMDRVPSWLGQW